MLEKDWSAMPNFAMKTCAFVMVNISTVNSNVSISQLKFFNLMKFIQGQRWWRHDPDNENHILSEPRIQLQIYATPPIACWLTFKLVPPNKIVMKSNLVYTVSALHVIKSISDVKEFLHGTDRRTMFEWHWIAIYWVAIESEVEFIDLIIVQRELFQSLTLCRLK